MKRIFILLMAMMVIVAGCKKKHVDPVIPPQNVPQCTGLTPFLSGKYITGGDTMYIDFNKNLCPASTFNEYTVRKFDSIMNNAGYRVPWGNYIVVSSKEEATSAFAKGQNLVVSIFTENDHIKVSATYNNSSSKVFTKVN